MLPACPFPSPAAGLGAGCPTGSPGLSPRRKQKRAPFSAAILEPAAGRQQWGTELPGLVLLLQRPARVTPLPPGLFSPREARGEDGNNVHLGGLRETGAGGEPLGLVLTRSVLGVSLEGGFGKICPMAPSVLVLVPAPHQCCPAPQAFSALGSIPSASPGLGRRRRVPSSPVWEKHASGERTPRALE